MRSDRMIIRTPKMTCKILSGISLIWLLFDLYVTGLWVSRGYMSAVLPASLLFTGGLILIIWRVYNRKLELGGDGGIYTGILGRTIAFDWSLVREIQVSPKRGITAWDRDQKKIFSMNIEIDVLVEVILYLLNCKVKITYQDYSKEVEQMLSILFKAEQGKV